MTIGIDDKRCIIVLTIERPKARRSVILAAVLKRCFVKPMNGCPRWRSEGEVEALARSDFMGSFLLQGQLVSASRQTISHGLALVARTQVAPYADIAERGEHGIVEARRHLNVTDAKRYVMKHLHGNAPSKR